MLLSIFCLISTLALPILFFTTWILYICCLLLSKRWHYDDVRIPYLLFSVFGSPFLSLFYFSLSLSVSGMPSIQIILHSCYLCSGITNLHVRVFDLVSEASHVYFHYSLYLILLLPLKSNVNTIWNAQHSVRILFDFFSVIRHLTATYLAYESISHIICVCMLL